MSTPSTPPKTDLPFQNPAFFELVEFLAKGQEHHPMLFEAYWQNTNFFSPTNLGAYTQTALPGLTDEQMQLFTHALSNFIQAGPERLIKTMSGSDAKQTDPNHVAIVNPTTSIWVESALDSMNKINRMYQSPLQESSLFTQNVPELPIDGYALGHSSSCAQAPTLYTPTNGLPFSGFQMSFFSSRSEERLMKAPKKGLGKVGAWFKQMKNITTTAPRQIKTSIGQTYHTLTGELFSGPVSERSQQALLELSREEFADRQSTEGSISVNVPLTASAVNSPLFSMPQDVSIDMFLLLQRMSIASWALSENDKKRPHLVQSTAAFPSTDLLNLLASSQKVPLSELENIVEHLGTFAASTARQMEIPFVEPAATGSTASQVHSVAPNNQISASPVPDLGSEPELRVAEAFTAQSDYIKNVHIKRSLDTIVRHEFGHVILMDLAQKAPQTLAKYLDVVGLRGMATPGVFSHQYLAKPSARELRYLRPKLEGFAIGALSGAAMLALGMQLSSSVGGLTSLQWMLTGASAGLTFSKSSQLWRLVRLGNSDVPTYYHNSFNEAFCDSFSVFHAALESPRLGLCTVASLRSFRDVFDSRKTHYTHPSLNAWSALLQNSQWCDQWLRPEHAHHVCLMVAALSTRQALNTAKMQYPKNISNIEKLMGSPSMEHAHTLHSMFFPLDDPLQLIERSHRDRYFGDLSGEKNMNFFANQLVALSKPKTK